MMDTDNRLVPPNEVASYDWRNFKFWKRIFLLYWLFAWVGHLVEYPWKYFVKELIIGKINVTYPPLFSVMVPYGIGAVILMLLLYPRPKNDGWVGKSYTFIVGAILCTFVEFVSAWIVTSVLGHNPYWNYTDTQWNLFGFVCLRSSLAFGFAAVLFVYVVFPWLDRLVKRSSEKWVDILFWIVAPPYFLIQIARF